MWRKIDTREFDMANPVLDFIGGIFKPVADLVDELHFSGEEKAAARGKIVAAQSALTFRMLEYEAKLMEHQASVIKAEAGGQSWLQRSWRPITMLTFLGLVVCDSFGLLEFRLADQAWTLLQIGLGGYVIGRSAEKVAPAVASMIRGAK